MTVEIDGDTFVTVAEMIEHLSKLSGELPVVVQGCDCSGACDGAGPSSIFPGGVGVGAPIPCALVGRTEDSYVETGR